MQVFKLSLAALIVMMAYASSTLALSTQNDGSANIVAPLNIFKIRDLQFGDIAPSLTQAGTVQVGAWSNQTCSAALTCFSTSPVTNTKYRVEGAADAVYTISVPSDVTLNGSGTASGENMSATLAPQKSTGTLDSGVDLFWIGGTLSVGANQAVGDYSGTFTVTVEYQ